MVGSTDSKALVKFPVSKLTIGMFVSAIDQRGQIAIANAGQIRTQNSIIKLKKNGIEYVLKRWKKCLVLPCIIVVLQNCQYVCAQLLAYYGLFSDY